MQRKKNNKNISWVNGVGVVQMNVEMEGKGLHGNKAGFGCC